MVSCWMSMCPSIRMWVCLSYVPPSILLFLDNDLSKRQSMFTKLCMWIDIMRSSLGLLWSKFWQSFSASHTSIFSVLDNNLSKYQWLFTKLICALILWRSSLGLLMGKFCQFSTELYAHPTSIFSFPDEMTTWVTISWFSPNLLCALML